VIKLTFCLRRLDGLSLEQFQHYWFDVHAPLVREVAGTLRIRRYVQSHLLADPRLSGISDIRGIQAAPFDGIAEIWWDDLADVLAAGETRETREAGRRLIADERNFIDLENSPLFFVNERDVIGE
jgi:uncharacterized protein (TIGR02118 family)